MLPLPSEIERKLLVIWKDVLDVRLVNVHKGFFKLGRLPLSHSDQVASSQPFQLKLFLRLLFQFTSIPVWQR